MLVEPYIAGKELTCAVMGDKALGVIEIVADREVLRLRGQIRARRLETSAAGAGLHRLSTRKCQRLSLAAHRALGCRGVTRADFRYDDSPAGPKGLFCLEVNTQPGMTETSLVPEMAQHAGIAFEELVRWMVEDASLDR